MRKMSQPPMPGVPQPVQNIFNLIFKASRDADLVDIAQAFSITGNFTETRVLNVTSPTTANIAAVLATFLRDCQRGGQNRTT